MRAEDVDIAVQLIESDQWKDHQVNNESVPEIQRIFCVSSTPVAVDVAKNDADSYGQQSIQREVDLGSRPRAPPILQALHEQEAELAKRVDAVVLRMDSADIDVVVQTRRRRRASDVFSKLLLVAVLRGLLIVSLNHDIVRSIFAHRSRPPETGFRSATASASVLVLIIVITLVTTPGVTATTPASFSLFLSLYLGVISKSHVLPRHLTLSPATSTSSSIEVIRVQTILCRPPRRLSPSALTSVTVAKRVLAA